MFAQIGKIEMRTVAVGPGDVYAGIGRDVDLYAGGFAAGMERDWHGT